MTLRITLAVLHLLALGIGLGGVYSRARALNDITVPGALKRAFQGDAWWGIAALLWLVTGLWRAFGSTEKSSDYYWTNPVFNAKLGLFGVIFLLELWPMITLIRWRSAERKGTLDTVALAPVGRRIARISDVQMVLLVAVVVAAVMMARGFGAG